MKRTFVVTGDEYARVAKWIAARYPEFEVLTPWEDIAAGVREERVQLVTCFCTCNLFWSGAEKIVEPDPFWGVLLPVTGNDEVDEKAWILRLDPLAHVDATRVASRVVGEMP